MECSIFDYTALAAINFHNLTYQEVGDKVHAIVCKGMGIPEKSAARRNYKSVLRTVVEYVFSHREYFNF